MTKTLLIICLIIATYVAATIFTNRAAKPRLHELQIARGARDVLPAPSLTVSTWNIGYAGLGADSDFVTDGGKHWRAPSRESVRRNLAGIVSTLGAIKSDLVLIQEIAEEGWLTYGIDVRGEVESAYDNRDRSFRPDLATRLIPWPLRLRHGTGLYSRYRLERAEVVPLPLEPTHVAGLVRKQYAMHVARLRSTEGALWTIINVHLSAFDDGAKIRRQQLSRVLEYAARDFAAGSHVVIGGDWNMRLVQTDFRHATESEYLFWVFDFPPEAVPDGWQIVVDEQAATVRTNQKPYVEGENYTTIIDGFLISPNVAAKEVRTMDLGFEHGDHHPVTGVFEVIPPR